MMRAGVQNSAAPDGADGTRERIEEVALPLLLERGYAGTPLRLIAKAADVTVPALYWHFSSKGELCSFAVAQEFRRFSDAVIGAIPPGSPEEQLRAYVTTFVAWQIRRRRGAMGLGFDDLVASLPSEHRVPITQIQRFLNERLRGILTEGRRTQMFEVSDVPLTAFAITSMCNYVFTWYKPGGRLDVEEVATRYAQIALRLAGCADDR